MHTNLFHKSVVLVAVFAASTLMLGVPANCAERVLYSFKGGADGAHPSIGVVEDDAGNLYGTTSSGGSTSCGQSGGCGTVFKLAPDGTESVLHAFQGGSDGEFPGASLILDSAGNLYGTTIDGGIVNQKCDDGCGTVFKVTPDGTETILYAFKGTSDGFGPIGLLMDKQGNMFGTASDDYEGSCVPGSGTIFKLSPDGTETVLYTFQGGADGCFPDSGLVMDNANNFYGTTQFGGTAPCECGTVFKLAPDGVETVLHSFQAGADGDQPLSGVAIDSAGNLFGTTFYGGGSCAFKPGCGTVFDVSTNGVESILYSFQGSSDGSRPYGGLVLDKAGNLYGTTELGGSCYHPNCGGGTAFRLSSDSIETVLYDFKRHRGIYPVSSLVIGKNGKLYGTTTEGGLYNQGVVFSLTK